MKVYESDRIRNVVLLGHGGCGKTTLTESMANISGITNRMGRVEDGNTISDFDKEEIKRRFSLSASVIPMEWEGIKINVLDAPGYFDFVGEAEEAASAADAAVIVINGKSGVEVGTQKAWELCEKLNLPRIIYVTNMDDDNASFRQVVEDLQGLYGKKIAPFQMPIRENEKFVGFVNVVKMAGRRFKPDGTYIDGDVPDYSQDYLENYREALMEAVAETSEEYMDRYFGGEEFTYDEVSIALRTHVMDNAIVPVLMGSSVNGYGTRMLLDVIEKYVYAPVRLKCQATVGGMALDLDYSDAKPMSAMVWKTLVDPFIGKYSLVKVCSGVLRAGSEVSNVKKETDEKIGKLYVIRGKEVLEVPELRAGDIGAIAKMAVTETGDTLAAKGKAILLPAPQLSVPYTYMAYKAKNKGEDDKIASALSKLLEEDKTLKLVNDTENRQSLIYAIGTQQLDIAVSKLANRYKVDVELAEPRVAYRETIRGKVKVQGKHKKQSGGHGQYGDVVMEFEPSGDLTVPYVFEEKIVGGVVPKNFFPAVEKGVQESVLRGPLAGYPVFGLKATLVYGSYHEVDSNEMSFKMAAILAVKNAFADAASKPVLLEPIVNVKVTVPDKFTGDVMGDMNKRRGRVLGMNSDHKGHQIIEIDVPMKEILGYSTDLRSMTGGMGSYAYEFARYEQAPSDVQAKEIAAKQAEE